MIFVERKAGVICGVYAQPQPGFAEEELPNSDLEVAAFLTPSTAVVTSVTPRQARLALLAAGLLDQVETAVNQAGGAVKITWDYATEINRNDPLITTLGKTLNLTDTQIDNLFTQAATL